jgi:hypothetical protein
MNVRVVISAAIISLAITGIGAGALWATGAIGQEGGGPGPSELIPDFDGLPPEKQAIELELLAEQQEAEAGARASKAAADGDVPSCPIDASQVLTGIFPYHGGPLGRYLVNEASAVSSSGGSYRVFAGALDPDPEEGVLFVQQQSSDPCATAAGLTPAHEMQTFKLPPGTGAVTLTAIEGDLIAFETAKGTGGRFNYTTGEFIWP